VAGRRGPPAGKASVLTKWPLCEALLRNGDSCRSVVVSAESENELERRFCAHHAKQAAEAADAKHAAHNEKDPPVEDVVESTVEDVVEDAPLEIHDPVDEGTAEVVTSRGTPRETIREFALANPHLVDEFLRGVLAAEQSVWVSCKHCKRRSEVAVPNWSARTKAVELLLEQGFGRPEPAPLVEDEKIRAAFGEMCEELSEEKLLEVADLADFQRRLLARPLMEQVALSDADAGEVQAIAEAHGYDLTPA
jgi:hypothetical protein